MDAQMIMVSPGPNVADPSDMIKIIVNDKVDRDFHYFTAPMGWRGWYTRLIVWAIRRHVRSLR